MWFCSVLSFFHLFCPEFKSRAQHIVSDINRKYDFSYTLCAQPCKPSRLVSKPGPNPILVFYIALQFVMDQHVSYSMLLASVS